MNTLFIIIALLLLGGGVAIYKFKFTAKPKAASKKPAKKRGATVKQVKPTNVDGIPQDMLDDPFFEKNPERDPLVKLAKEADKKKPARKPRRKKRAKK